MYNFQSEKWSKIKMKKILVVKIHYFIAFLCLNWCNKQHEQIIFVFLQSLNMYVPAPDEAVHDLGEINMTFEGENVTAEHIGGDQGITSAVNPIYQE